jgi:hypothetical protein
MSRPDRRKGKAREELSHVGEKLRLVFVFLELITRQRGTRKDGGVWRRREGIWREKKGGPVKNRGVGEKERGSGEKERGSGEKERGSGEKMRV